MRVPRIVRLCNGQEVIGAANSKNGMPYLTLGAVLSLPNLNKEGVALEEVHLSDNMNVDPLDLLHERCGHYSESTLLEGFNHMLFTGSRLTRAHLSKSFFKKLRGQLLCKSCAIGKVTRRSFREAEPEVLSALRFLGKVTADIAVYLNCPSRQRFCYVLVLTDVATKMFWEYPRKFRSGDKVFTSISNWVEYTLPTYPGDNILRHYHADESAELIDQPIKKLLLDELRKTVTWGSTDTPEHNAVLERKFRTLEEMTLSMLADLGLPKLIWWDAYVTASNITRMLPTRTHKGWTSPKECVPVGRTPNLFKLRRWGCKAYVLVPKADRRKDWEDKARVGYFLGYSKTKVFYRVLLGDTVVTSLHVFDESIPARTEDYFNELEEATVKVNPEERRVCDFDWLVGKPHMDEGLPHNTTRFVDRRGLIVGFRALVTAAVYTRHSRYGHQIQCE